MAVDHKFREQKRKVEQVLADAGVTRYEFIETGRGHHRVCFYRDGNPRPYHVGFANSDDWRASKNSMSDLRKKLEESKHGCGNGDGHPGVAAAQPGQQPARR